MDTASDFRIRLAEKGVSELERLIHNLKVQKRKEIANKIREMGSYLQIIKYSYVSPEELVEMDEFKKIVEIAKELNSKFKNGDFNMIQAKYWLEYIADLPKLMKRGEIDRAYKAIKYFCGTIVSRTEVEKDKLWLCTVDCGFKLEVVTNSKEFVQGVNAIVAYLPPRKFGKIISRGMFVGKADCKKGEFEPELGAGVESGVESESESKEANVGEGVKSDSDYAGVESIIFDLL